ncbi:protein of unknown function DUF89 [Halanaerobium praevalens DSM 2228]|uniref:Damage-control phosphatase ARMT1-like metal-binding domain-containing protein n=1 Tax=Halanaerobium praevalens (strain ATCC 33744 / DSM 2228 / GSL) TaxID=572479 RepID=E3DM66_HALPG|nr:ARMT1-like domain-containing protein [Halanaerobium praevalens]ADO77344.1 protein of unknown function DUF89 [Halanaerobium praevalens DSM 2228]
MGIKYDCFPCLFKQFLESARMANDDEEFVKEILRKYSQMLPDLMESDFGSAVISAEVQAYITELSGIRDPYRKFKQEKLEIAKKLLPLFKAEIKKADDPLLITLLISALGNSKDKNFDFKQTDSIDLAQILNEKFNYNDYQNFKADLKNAAKILFIADNTGEALFDKLLLAQLKKYDVEIKYAVRECPILNDITMEEAQKLTIDEYAEIINSGSRTPGMPMEAATAEFEAEYQNADLIISKGQGNLETLFEKEKGIYFLLKAKCALIADSLGVKKNDFIFIRH